MNRVGIAFIAFLFTAVCSHAGGYWTLDAARGSMPEEAVPWWVSLKIEGADQVVVFNLPKDWGVSSSTDKTGIFYVDIAYHGKDGGAALKKIPLVQILAAVEIRSGPLFRWMERSADDGEPDRSKAVKVEVEVGYFLGFDPKSNPHRRNSQSLKLHTGDFGLTFHPTTEISGSRSTELEKTPEPIPPRRHDSP